MTLYQTGYRKPKHTIKQVMPLPAGTTVMMEFMDDGDGLYWLDCRDTPYSVGLALVTTEDGMYGGDSVLPYSYSDGEVMTDNSVVVNLMTCPHCGKEMKPHLENYEPADLYHTCDCGCILQWVGKWVEVKPKKHKADKAEKHEQEKNQQEKNHQEKHEQKPFCYVSITELSRKMGESFLSLGRGIPRERFYFRSDKGWIAIDNHSGDAWVEAFNSEEDCLSWLRGEKEVDDDEDDENEEG